MALRNYMYFKHEDELKDVIAHGLDGNSKNSSAESAPEIKKKPKKITPTQARKLRMEIADLRLETTESSH